MREILWCPQSRGNCAPTVRTPLLPQLSHSEEREGEAISSQGWVLVTPETLTKECLVQSLHPELHKQRAPGSDSAPVAQLRHLGCKQISRWPT